VIDGYGGKDLAQFRVWSEALLPTLFHAVTTCLLSIPVNPPATYTRK